MGLFIYLKESYLSLLFNGIIMLGSLSLFTMIKLNFKNEKLLTKIIRGILMGIIVIIVMLRPWEGEQLGVYHDSRNVLLAITGSLYGPITAVITALIAVIYRILLGGSGLILGVFGIVTATLIGIAWPYLYKKYLKRTKDFNYFLLGLMVHLVLYLNYLIIPNDIGDTFIKETLLLYLLIYPLLTIAAATIIKIQKKTNNLLGINLKQKQILNAAINSPKTVEVYVLDNNYKYLVFNDFHKKAMKSCYNVKIKPGDDYLSFINNIEMKNRIVNGLNTAISNNEHIEISEVEVTPGKFVEERYSPIYDENEEIIGATVFSYEVTERIKRNLELEKLSYFDTLTNVYNRRYFEEKINEYENSNRPVTIIYFDINGLKTINDTFGHKTGDILLKEAAKVMERNVKKLGVVCRIGGDEFVIILENANYEEAYNIATKIKDELIDNKINNISISASFGVESSNKKSSMDSLLKAAEDEMYTNKLTEKSSYRSQNIQAIINTLTLLNKSEEKHAKNVADYSVLIGKKLKLPQNELELLELIAGLHDIGKIGIDPIILNKEDKLTEEEFNIIKRHPEIGYRLLSDVPEYRKIAYDILSHHERWDGKGYPNGLKGDNIPLRARIIALADAFDAMTSDRPYRKALTKEEALKELKTNAGTQFDPRLTKIFINILKLD